MTVRVPEFQLAETTHTGLVTLKVADLEKQTAFYTDVIGLRVLSKKDDAVSFGTEDGVPLLILTKVENPLPLSRRTGLYHVAFLLPSRQALGDALIHYLSIDAPLVGASDHGYSEALYLSDPEGNGIEVYRDKPVDQWDIREDGEIIGVTEEMDAQGVVNEATQKWNGFPSGTKVGHVHLKIADLQKTEDFYTDILGLSLKNNYGNQAKFFATGNYHHHIGSNIWMGRNVPAMTEHDLGLAYYSFYVTQDEELARIESHWAEQKVPFEKDEQGSLWILDPNGILIKFEKEARL